MIKTIFFDFFGTLAKFYPDREEIQIQALNEFDIATSPQQIKYGYKFADSYMEKINSSNKPISLMDSNERIIFFSEYELLILDNAGIQVDLITARNIWKTVQQIPYGFKLYDDVIPVLSELYTSDFNLGIITNMGKSLYDICDQLEISKFLSFIITSEEVGIGKPSPEIFQSALSKSECEIHEVIHVGDSYDSDIAGALSLGIKALLINRDEELETTAYSLVINQLYQIYDYL